MDFLKSIKGGPFGSAGGRIPDGWGTSAPPPNVRYEEQMCSQ